MRLLDLDVVSMLTMSHSQGVFMNAKKRKPFERKTVFEEGIEAAKIEAAKRQMLVLLHVASCLLQLFW